MRKCLAQCVVLGNRGLRWALPPVRFPAGHALCQVALDFIVILFLSFLNKKIMRGSDGCLCPSPWGDLGQVQCRVQDFICKWEGGTKGSHSLASDRLGR